LWQGLAGSLLAELAASYYHIDHVAMVTTTACSQCKYEACGGHYRREYLLHAWLLACNMMVQAYSCGELPTHLTCSFTGGLGRDGSGSAWQ